MANTVEITGKQAVFYVRSLKDMREVCIGGIVYTCMVCPGAGTQIKVSPCGIDGDYDTGSYFIYYCDIPHEFDEGKTYAMVVD